ncbi:hypothetical protein [Hyphobacterium sp.]|uniref:hypothetical protein n=1 Tax=Hyphobacterium sp. TaxID=2004662 RepID=UPI003B5186F2
MQVRIVPARLDTPLDGARLHPQFIHYPRGGGYFGRHVHPFQPQKIGLIVALTASGTHFDTGSTLFWDERDRRLDLDAWQAVGSDTAFRYDLPHAVSGVDTDAQLAFGTPTGRWVAIMPLH